MPWALRRDEHRIHARRRLNLAEMHVEAVRSHQNAARLQIRLDRRAIRITLNLIRQQYVDDIRRLGRFLSRHRLELVLDRQVVVRTARPLADDYIYAAVAKVLRLSMSLAAVAQDGDRLAFEERKVSVVVVVNGGWH